MGLHVAIAPVFLLSVSTQTAVTSPHTSHICLPNPHTPMEGSVIYTIPLPPKPKPKPKPHPPHPFQPATLFNPPRRQPLPGNPLPPANRLRPEPPRLPALRQPLQPARDPPRRRRLVPQQRPPRVQVHPAPRRVRLPLQGRPVAPPQPATYPRGASVCRGQRIPRRCRLPPRAPRSSTRPTAPSCAPWSRRCSFGRGTQRGGGGWWC